MSTSQWVQVLTEDGLTMELSESHARQYIPCRAEAAAPDGDWDQSWRLCRLPGLSSNLTSFNFKLLHLLLPTKARLHHLNPNTSPVCSHCTEMSAEDVKHALLHCTYNNGAGHALSSTILRYCPSTSTDALLRLEFNDLPENLEYPVTFFTTTILLEIWEKRASKSKITFYDIRATLEARCLLLRETRFKENIKTLLEMTSCL